MSKNIQGYYSRYEPFTTEELDHIYSAAKNGILPDRRFIVFGQGRSGSSLLCSLLNSHSQIQCDGEMLKFQVGDLHSYVDGISKMSSLPNYGIKVKYYQISKDQKRDPQEFLNHLHAEGWKILHLRRKDNFRHAISGIISHRTGTYHTETKMPVRKITIGIPQLEETMKKRVRHYEEEVRLLENIPHKCICYEDHLLKEDQQQSTMNEVFDYLGLPKEAVATSLVKIVKGDWKDFCENSDEIKRFLDQPSTVRFIEQLSVN